MIGKERLLRLLEKCLALEEQSAPFYGRFDKDPGFFSGFGADDLEYIAKLLSRLARESEFHMQVYRDLIASVNGSVQNEF